LYRAEKAALDFPSDPFMSFADWKEEYTVEYRKTHRTVDVKEAMAEADALVEEAEAELFNDQEEMSMSETNVSGVVGSAPPIVVDVDAQAPVVAAPEAPKAKRKAAAKPKAKVKAAPKKKVAKKAAKPAKARVARKDNKTAAAQAIFDRMYGKKPRKDVIAAFVEKVGLTPNGASTYYQKLKAAV